MTRFWLRTLTRVNFNNVNNIEARYNVLRLNVLKVERGSTFTLTSDRSCFVSILFANVQFRQVRT